MAKIVQFTTSGGGVAVAQGTTRFSGIGDSSPFGNSLATTETNVQSVYRTAGTLTLLYIRVSANTLTTTLTIQTRKNAGNGNLVVSIATTLTGEFEDTTNSDSISAGDKLNYTLVAPAGTGSVTIRNFSTVFEATSNTVKVLSTTYAGIALGAVSTTVFLELAGSEASFYTGTEADVKYKIETAGTLSNLFINATANTKPSATTFNTRINAVDGNLTVSITANTSGFFEDTTHSDTISVTNLVNYKLVTGTGTGSITLGTFGCNLSTTSSRFHIMIQNSSQDTANISTTTYYAPGGSLITNATESIKQSKARIPFTAAFLFVNIKTNGITAASTFTFRKNAGNGNLTVSVASTLTGVFEDSTHTDSVASTDEINYLLVTGGTGTNIATLSIGILAINNLLVSVSDSSVVSDTPTLKITSYINVSDSTSIQESVTMGSVIVFDNTANFSSALTSISGSYTTSGTNRGLVAFVYSASSLFDIQNPTYGGVVMQDADEIQLPAGYTGFVAAYYMTNPATGSNTFSVARSGTGTIFRAVIASYYNVEQDNDTDGTSTATVLLSNTITGTVITTFDNDWTIFGVVSGLAGTLSAGSGSFARTNVSPLSLFDSNSSVGALGSHSMTVTSSAPTDGMAGVILAINPYIFFSTQPYFVEGEDVFVFDTPTIFITTLMISVSDSSTVSDTQTDYITTRFLSVSDSSTVSDLGSISFGIGTSVSDTTTVTDTVSLFITKLFLSVSDSAAIGDSAIISEGAPASKGFSFVVFID